MGERHPEDFGYNKNWKGWHSVKGNLLHDFNSLLGMELLPWDLWTELSTKKYNNLSRQEKNLLDEMAMLTTNPTITEEELTAFQNRLPVKYMEAIHSKLKLLGINGQSETFNPDALESKFVILSSPRKKDAATPIKENAQQLVLKGCRQNNLKKCECKHSEK